jgi:hypothetical protein
MERWNLDRISELVKAIFGVGDGERTQVLSLRVVLNSKKTPD